MTQNFGLTEDRERELIEVLGAARNVVVFTGAGMSAESGLLTFRDRLTGMWSALNVEDLATPEGFRRDPARVWGWYEWRRMHGLKASPNAGHLAVARAARFVPLTVVTQNVDTLHERAGSQDVLHLHGDMSCSRCFDCGAVADYPPGIPDEPENGRALAPPPCPVCGGMLRPNVVWFGEGLPQDTWQQAAQACATADVFFCVGTSGVVYPAAMLPDLALRNGAALIVVNPEETPLDAQARFVLRGTAASVLPDLLARVA